MEKETILIINQIVDRAKEAGLMQGERVTLFMDLCAAEQHFKLKVEELLNANDEDFAHDIIGIQQNIDRCHINDTHDVDEAFNNFVPRFASEGYEEAERE